MFTLRIIVLKNGLAKILKLNIDKLILIVIIFNPSPCMLHYRGIFHYHGPMDYSWCIK